MMNLILLFALAATPRPNTAPAPAELYNRGNSHYSAGSYREAISAYRQALQQADHPHVRFNLGNAYFKEGQLGMAIVQYRRARALSPRDREVAFNLEFLRSYRVDKTTSQTGPLGESLARAFTLFPGGQASLYAGLCFLLAAFLLSLKVVFRKQWAMKAAVLPLSAFVYFTAATQVWEAERRSNPGAVTAKEVSALSGPGADFKEILLLHDGTEVSIREARGDYLLVQLPGGMGGWVPKGAVERVY